VAGSNALLDRLLPKATGKDERTWSDSVERAVGTVTPRLEFLRAPLERLLDPAAGRCSLSIGASRRP
jgi:hypothetical protein